MPHIARCTGIKNSQPKSTVTTFACLSSARQPFRKAARTKKRSAPNPGLILLPAWRLCLHTVVDQTNSFNPPPPDLVGDIPLPRWALGH